MLDYDTLKQDLTNVMAFVSNDNSDAAMQFKKIVSNSGKALNSLASNMSWTENQESFVKFLSIDPVNKGFKAEAIRMNSDVMSQIYVYLIGVFAKNRV